MVSLYKTFGSLNRYLRSYSRSYCRRSKNPFTRTWDVISADIPSYFGLNKKPTFYPEHADIVVIGGGLIGASVAYWLKIRAGEGLSVVVIEKDSLYTEMQKTLSLGTLTQHYSLPENILLAKFGAEFLRNYKEHLYDNIDLQYCPHGHLVLANEKYAERLEGNVQIQREFGVRSELLTVDDIKQRYPWISNTDVHLGCIGTECEGTFNAWTYLKSLIKKSIDLGTTFVNAEVIGFELEQQRDMLMEGIEPGSFMKINRVLYRTPDKEEYGIKFAVCVLAAGEKSGEIAKLAKIGTGDGLLKIPLPVQGREHKIYSIQEDTGKLSLNTPMITDTSGLWLQRNGLQDSLLCGHIPFLSANVAEFCSDEYYDNIIKPSLLNRIPDFKDAKVKNVIKETYDFNSYDDSGILGPHPYHNNLVLATGFGKTGCAHSAGIGRAIAELIIDSNFTTIDLTRLTFDRLLTDSPMIECNVY